MSSGEPPLWLPNWKRQELGVNGPGTPVRVSRAKGKRPAAGSNLLRALLWTSISDVRSV